MPRRGRVLEPYGPSTVVRDTALEADPQPKARTSRMARVGGKRRAGGRRKRRGA